MAENGEDEVVRLLQLWGLSDLKAKFKANYIVLQALEFLTEEDIIELIPKIGQRAIFRGRLLQWRQKNCVSAPKSLTSYKIEKPTKSEAEPLTTEKVKEPTPPPPVALQPKPLANLTKSPPAKSPQIIKITKPTDEKLPKPCIQSKVQKFYISPGTINADAQVPLPTSPGPVISPHMAAPDLTPFVTSIIRVETNCDKKRNAQSSESTPPTKVNRTRILQKIKICDKPPIPLPDSPARVLAKPAVTKPAESRKSAGEESCEEQGGESQTDARHLYPIIKLETESADANWTDYNSEPEMQSEPAARSQVITKREPEEVAADSMDFQPAPMTSIPQDFYSENDNPLTKLEQMTAKDIPRPRRKRIRTPRKFDIRNILMNTRMGQHVLQYYEKNDHLDSERRRMLIDAIIQDCWARNHHISPSNCLIIAKEIVAILPNEKVEDYFQAQTGKNAKSPLYNKFRNMRRRIFIERNGLTPRTYGGRKSKKTLKQVADDIETDDIIIS